jgi:hypothetical protein
MEKIGFLSLTRTLFGATLVLSRSLEVSNKMMKPAAVTAATGWERKFAHYPFLPGSPIPIMFHVVGNGKNHHAIGGPQLFWRIHHGAIPGYLHHHTRKE